MVDAPLLIVPAGFRPEQITRQDRDRSGRRVETTYKRRADTGRIGGYEHRPATTMGTAGMQNATVCPPTVTRQIRASDFGLTVEEMRRVVEATGALLTRPKPHGGLILPGGTR
jgi:hypothetical protein